MTPLEKLLGKVPEGLRPVVVQYGPALLAMSAEEVWAWVQMLVEGKTAEAYANVINTLSPSDKLEMMAADLAKWDTLNVANAAKVGLQREAAMAVLKALLTIALAMVGL